MTTDLPIMEARKQLTKLPEMFEQTDDLNAITVTRRGRPVLAIMPAEHYQALMETLEIINDESLLA
ncbi:MAG TPA: type II toxin-antitoxin system prevent-host-death family antitoxin, partial [Candidatus Wirthbacteria bacterium]|nr:type II toxin-antitoxin system prevent-host-death family antitoxin [Candidatus Wirthbacteria bacterium]